MGRPIPPTRSSGVCSTTSATSSPVCLPTCSTDRCWRCARLSLATVQPCSKSGRVATSRPSCPTASPPLIPPPPDICLFTPSRPALRKRPLLLYLHGGGWCFGSINSCARFCATLALEADCCVAALDYRLSPAHPFPAPLDDCRRAFAYLRQHADAWGCDSTQVAVGGDSAGGNLALATALSTKGVSRVVPIYPVTRLYTRVTPSWTDYAQGYGDDAELLEAFCEAYARGEEYNPLVSVELAADDALRSLPPMCLISAGHDILFDQTTQLAQRLQRLGHRLTYHVFPTATHLFITVPGQPTAFAEAVSVVARFLNAPADALAEGR